MKIRQAIIKYLKPWLESKNYVMKKEGRGILTFEKKDNIRSKIGFTIGGWIKNSICTEIIRDRSYGSRNILCLSLFINGPEAVDETLSDCRWYFDNDLELLGVLEKQMELLENWGFDWLDGKLKINLEEILDRKSIERRNRWNNSSVEERNKRIEEGLDKKDKWIITRFKPNKLKPPE